MSNLKKKIIITGGHHTSALPIIDLLEDNNVEVIWAGHKYSVAKDSNETLEYREISSMGISFINLIAGKFYKTYNPLRLLKIPVGFVHSLFVLLKHRPDIVLSFGGYLAVPVVVMAWFLRIPCYTHEQTVVAGYANKLISKFVKKVFISWKQSEQYFPKNKVIYSGLPLRDDIFESTSNNFQVNGLLPTIYTTAGKTGSHKINLVIEDSLQEILNFANIIHQTGDHSEFKDNERIALKYSGFANEVNGKYISRKFVLKNEIGEAYDKADLVVSRSGAHTSLELLVLEKPALLIPIPWVSHNEQLENAKVVKDSGIGEILEEKNLTKDAFVAKVKEMLNSIDNYKISQNARVERLDSAKIIVDEILK